MRLPHAVLSATLLLVAACSPSVVSIQEWMLGAFSTYALGPVEYNGVAQHIVHEDGTLEYISLNTSGPFDPKHRTWEPTGEDEFVLYSGPDDDDLPDGLYEWVVTRNGECGPHYSETFRDGMPAGEGPAFHPGEFCIVGLPPCDPEDPMPPEGCGFFEIVVCEGGQPPPPECEGGADG